LALPSAAAHPAWGVVALPLLARLYVRAKDLPGIEARHRPEFRTKLVLAVELLRWAKLWLGLMGMPLWVVADGAYAKADFLKPAQALGMTVGPTPRPAARTPERRDDQHGGRRVSRNRHR
jgi:hypothetical protein